MEDWLSSSHAVDAGLSAIVQDMICRGQSLILEGVHVRPSRDLIEQWRAAGGSATGVLLKISDADAHRQLIYKRGELLKKGAEQQLREFERIRAIQDGMVRMAQQAEWIIIEQQLS